MWKILHCWKNAFFFFEKTSFVFQIKFNNIFRNDSPVLGFQVLKEKQMTSGILFTHMGFEIYYSIKSFSGKKVNIFHFLIIQAHLQHIHLFFHRTPGLTSYLCNTWSSKIMNVFKHFFDLCCWLTNHSQGKWGGIPPNMPFSPSSSHLSFLPKSCFHSCILLLMFTLCGPFLTRK